MATGKASKKSGGQSPTNGSSTKVVGPNIKGNLEEYQLVMHLQSALFGGVYEAKGRSTGKDFAIKVLHKSELQKVEENNSIEFCEVPLSEIKFADVMRGHEHVMEVEEHFDDQYCHYCVFELCKGGDLLEALKQKPMGFDERHAQFLIRQAALGLTYLHDRGVAMQDVSLENMLLNVNPSNGNWQVKICDPGQAVHFQTDSKGQEVPVNFHGLVGKSFRPPELHEHKSYLATKVDSWCLGWSTFYLLTAQPLFMSADPAQKDVDWTLFRSGKFDELFKTKTPNFSAVGIDFIFKLMQMEPSKRMSIAEACKHAWLADTGVPPMMAPKEMLPEELRKKLEEEKRAKTMLPVSMTDRDFKGGSLSASTGGVPTAALLPTVSSPIMRPMTHTLPTWSAAPIQGIITKQMATPHTPLMRVRSPSGRSPRSSAPGPSFADLSQASDRRSRVFQPHRSTQRTQYTGGYVLATAHSPAPARGSSGAMSPPADKLCMAANFYCHESNRISFVSTPRASHRRTAAAPAPLPMVDAESRGRPLWAFGQKAAEQGPSRRWGSNGSEYQVSPAPRASSPVPVAMAVTRVASPPPVGLAFIPPMLGSSRRAASPRAVYQVSRSPSPECPFGFFYLSATQLVAAAGKGTNHMPPFSNVMNQVVRDLPFIQVSSSPWPIWHVLAVFSDMNKGDWFWGGDRKYFRGFSDWNLRRDELSPLVSPSLDFLSPDWRRDVVWKVEALKKMDHLTYIQTLKSWTKTREESWGQLRQIAMSMIDAASALAARAHQQQLTTRLAYVVLLYGDGWAQLLQRMQRRMAQLALRHPLLVIAIGAAAPVCRALSGQDVICWVPDTASQVHRFTGIQGLLHLGIDVIYLDMDTFLLRDPTERFQAAADDWDALFARHGDGDCINIGIFYLKASGRTAVWMSQFLTWYHDHPFEIDQRGLHIFLALPAQVLQVASVPEDLVPVRGSVLEDLNEVVIGDIGWLGSLSQMLIFHWCHRPLELKVKEMNLAYDGADALEEHELPMSVALYVAAGAVPGSPWAKVVAVRYMFDTYQLKEAPPRKVCW